MSLAQLLAHVAPDRHNEVERRYAAFTADMHTLADEHIDSFAKVLNERGFITTEALHDFLTFRTLMVAPADMPASDASAMRYEVMTLLGRGGMGEVFLGSEPTLRRTVAIKRLKSQDPAHYRRFITEAQVTAQLDHPAIMPVYGFERDTDGTPAYAMKFVRGVTLTELINTAEEQIKAHGRADPSHSLKARVTTFVPVLNALAYAHRRGVLHRDLKPDNIMVGRFGEVIVLDWGIARLIGAPQGAAIARDVGTSTSAAAGTMHDTIAESVEGPAATTDAAIVDGEGLTRVGAVMGTPDFMSPEQAKGDVLDAAADQYALGLILQEIATRRPAIAGRSDQGVLARAMRGHRAPIVEVGERIPRELRSIIAKATQFNKAERYASVEAMADDVRRFLRDESVLADPDSGVRRVTRWIGNHRGLAMGFGIGLLCLSLAVLAVILWQGEVALESERQAARARERTVMALGATVDARAKRMTEQLHRYETLLNELATSARIFLSEPAPASSVVVYKYKDGEREPAAIPKDAVTSAVYGQVTSLRHADFSAAPEIDRDAMRPQIDQLARLEPVLRSTLLGSVGREAQELSFARAEHLVLQKGVPLVWTYFGAASGLSVGMPGTWDYDDSPGVAGYDHRKEAWYLDALPTREIVWSSGIDENGLGILLGAAQVVRDDKGAVLGVAAIDLAMGNFIDDYLEIPELAAKGAEALLIDREGRVQVRSSQKEAVRTATTFAPQRYEEPLVLEAMKAAELGHVMLPDGRMALWATLGRVGLTYLIVGREAALLAP